MHLANSSWLSLHFYSNIVSRANSFFPFWNLFSPNPAFDLFIYLFLFLIPYEIVKKKKMENPRSATATPPYFLATTSLATPSVSASFQVRLIEPNPSWLYVANTATTIALPSATITNTAVVCISLLRAFSLLFLIGVQSVWTSICRWNAVLFVCCCYLSIWSTLIDQLYVYCLATSRP